MVNVRFTPKFQKLFFKIKDSSLKEKVLKQILKLEANPEAGKPMRYFREGTRELYIKPFRLSYQYIKEEEKVLLLALYHKDGQ
jgi:mRNA-degrading endonuclease RelE of RelBE toxin-antitoxin system